MLNIIRAIKNTIDNREIKIYNHKDEAYVMELITSSCKLELQQPLPQQQEQPKSIVSKKLSIPKKKFYS